MTLLAIFSLTAMPALAIQISNYNPGLGTKDIRESVMNIINVMLGFVGILAIVIILWGGFRWLTSGGNEEKIGEAKKVLTSGIIGLIIIFTAYALANFVITQLMIATGAI